MTQFSKDSTAFLIELEANNNRDWFAANKARYEEHIKQPAQAFAEIMAAELEKLTGTPHSWKLFRIYRDVRFSKDKTPYNTHQRISFTPVVEDANPPGWFFGLEKDHIVLGAGVFGYQKDALTAFRDRIAGAEGAALAEFLEQLAADGVRLSEPDLKRVSAGYDTDHERADLLRHKGIAGWIDHTDAGPVLGSDSVKNCITDYRKVKPLMDWLHC